MALHSVGIQIGHRLYNVLLSQEHLADIRKRGMTSEVVQELLLNQDFTVMGPEIPHAAWEAKILYDFKMKADGVGIISIFFYINKYCN